ncbi:hypothetical protein E1264_08390 [Actinomadura sp. KC216]|uniref:actinodefensin-associated protein B n=1 Tax=Actinomadura sp. KC216 TaxID=2530370 RepID=UPI00104335E0|nr:actinodefensin-associated protein B [Actinomadura sp. KC216]TDB89422.1 hypothetical protein E1264_08390 [Actinomadura sp. KC216]
MRTAPGVTFTRLPHGGAVLVDGTTLALAECGEPEAVLIEHLLAHGPRNAAEADPTAETDPTAEADPVAEAVPAAGKRAGDPPPALLRRMAEQMIESGWLLDDRRS